MSVRYIDSTKKIFYYLDNLKEVTKISPLFYRSYTCPVRCGACCPRFSLDWFPGTKRYERFRDLYPDYILRLRPRFIKYNHEETLVWSDMQDDHEDHFCRNLDMTSGRCKIHQANPFTCDFELNKIPANGIIIKKLFSRKWQMLNVTDERGTKCEMISYTLEQAQRDLELFIELQTIARRFELKFKVLNNLIRSIEERINVFKSSWF